LPSQTPAHGPYGPPQHEATNHKQASGAVNDNSSTLLAIGAWGTANHDAIEALAAIGSLFFAVVLTGSTIGLWIVTRTAANAAKAAADALPRLERAYLFFANAESQEIVTYASCITIARYDNVLVKYSYRNHGRTPAIIKSILIGAKYLEHGFPKMSDALGGNLIADVIVGDDLTPGGDQYFNMSGKDFDNAKNGIGRVFFWGELGYEDVFGNYCTTGICSEWHFRQSRFVISNNKALNYRT